MTGPRVPPEHLALAAIAAAAAGLRLWGLSAGGLYIDEYFEAFAAWKPAALGRLLDILKDNPLHMLLGPLANYVLGRGVSSVCGLRVFNALLGAATVVPMHFLGRRLGGARVGLAAAALLAFSLPHAEWSRRLPFYPPMVLWTVLSTLCLLRALEGSGRRAWAPYAAVLCAFVYTHPYAFVAMALQGAWIAAARRASLRRWAECAGLMLAAYFPWHAFAGGQLLSRRWFYFNELYGWHPLACACRALRQWAQSPEGTWDMLSGPQRAVSLASASAYAALAGAGAVSAARRGWPGAWPLAAVMVPGGLTSILALDWAFSYFPYPRQVLFALPFYLLFVAEGIAWAADALASARLAWSAAAALLGALALPVHRADARLLCRLRELKLGSVRRVLEQTAPSEVLLFAGPNNAEMFLFDFDREAFLKAEHPRMSGGFYQFRLPDRLLAGFGRSQRVFSIVKPGATMEEERARWRELVGGPGSKVTLTYADPAKPLPGEEAKLREFAAFARRFESK